MPNVDKAAVNLATSRATVTGSAALDELVDMVRKTGYEVPTITEQYAVGDVTCASCVGRMEKALLALSGVQTAQVNLATLSAEVQFIPGIVDFSDLKHAVEESGYQLIKTEADEALEDVAEQERKREYLDIIKRLKIGAGFVITTFLVMHWNKLGLGELIPISKQANHLIQWILITPVQFWVGLHFHQSALASVRHGTANMHTLVSVGTSSAYFYSLLVLFAPELFMVQGIAAEVYFDTSGAIIVLILLGRFLEARAKGNTSQAIRKLMGLAPKTARVIRDGVEQDIPLSEVVAGDHVVVRPGEKAPVDGTIIEGTATLDESMITGESIPVNRGPGDPVVGGTINRTGAFTFEAQKVGKDTVLAQIVDMVQKAQGAKPPIARLADDVAAWFVPVVIVIALVTFLVWWLFGPEPALTYGLLNFISVLIIACPCALGLATPTSIMVGTGKGAEHGILVRGGEALETAHKLDVVMFDKTGTLTQGEPVLTDWTGDEEGLRLAASAEKRSEHPLAQAIVERAEKQNLKLSTPENFHSITGQGVDAIIEGRRVLVGTRRLMQENGMDVVEHSSTLEAYEEDGKTAMLVAIEGTLSGVLAVADTVKESSAQAVKALGEMGVEVVMLTGDNQRTANAIARQLGIQNVRAEVLPEHKSGEVKRLMDVGKTVAMVGDGVNDAPALAQANVGIAIGTGTDIAMEASDITLMSGDPRGVATAIRLSRATLRNIKQNLFWAFAYNVVLIPLAAGVWFPWFGILLSPIFVSFALLLFIVTVVTNALRLKRFKPF
ncbi:MAG: copper-translocating P-type ATPase [Magnetococcales bacterium]|nr:copper-translocating P-type ATPase [Magnetococcales bacterium]